MKRLFLALAAMALAFPAFAADETTYRTNHDVRALAFGTVSFSTTDAIPTGFRAVRLVCTTACYVSFGVSNAAASLATAATGAYLPADTPENFKVNPGEHVQVIRVSSNGILIVTPISQ